MTGYNQVLVTGGTGKLGSVLVSQLYKNNFRFTILTSKTVESASVSLPLVYGNLVTGEGLKTALQETDIIIHCASNFLDHENVDVAGTQNLMNNLDKAGLKLLVYVSIVGVEEISLPYYQSKRKAEKLIQQSGFPYLILRFTQFHDFVLYLLTGFEQSSSALPYLEIPDGLQFQSISIEDVAGTIISNMRSMNKGLIETGGPEIQSLNKMAETFLRFRKSNKRLNVCKTEDNLHQAFIGGKNTTPNKLEHGNRWEAFLAQQYS